MCDRSPPYNVDKPVEIVDKLLPRQISSEPKQAVGPLLGIFAKAPISGRVKTRLCPPLTAAEAAELYRVSLAETVTGMSRGRFATLIFYDGPEEFFRTAFPDVQRLPQGPGDLGERMQRALAEMFSRGRGAVALIGSDSPDLPVAWVEQAFSWLQQTDIVTIPACDGGYALIGLRRQQPALFRNIPWSTADVLTATRRRATELAASYRELSVWEDVDDFAALQRLVQRSPDSATAVFARTRLARYFSTVGSVSEAP